MIVLSGCKLVRATLLMCGSPTANQPTGNQPMEQTVIADHFVTGPVVPTIYLSARITTAHENVDAVVKLFSDASWYILYPHSGKNGNNEHFHVLVCGCTAAEREKYRKRFKAAGFVGNSFVSIKLLENGVTSGISYCRREGTQVVFKGVDCPEWIRISPEWVPPAALKKRRTDQDFVQINCFNMVKIAFEYRREEGKHSKDLAEIIGLMLSSGHYVLSSDLVRKGCPDWFQEVFRESCEKGRIVYNPSVFKTGLFRNYSV